MSAQPYDIPSIEEFKAYWFRDFPYGTDPATSVTDADIIKAYGQTGVNFNQMLFSDQSTFNIGWFLLSAHYLVMDLRMSSQGIASKFSWGTQSKSVGSVSEAQAIPQRILDNPEFAYLVTTGYGAKFLNLILPQLSGQMFVVAGRTLP